MAIKPTDIPNTTEREALDRAERELDLHLLNNFKGKDLFCHLPDCTPYHHRSTLVDRYRAAGWQVYRRPSPEDGPGCNDAWYFGVPSSKPEPV